MPVRTRPRSTALAVLWVVLVITGMAVLTHVVCGCYGPGDKLPPENAPGASPDYPSSPSFMHRHDAGAR